MENYQYYITTAINDVSWPRHLKTSVESLSLRPNL